MVAFIIGNIFINGKDHLSWRFISAAPEEGMTAGGIFPAIYGTLLLVILMTVAVVPVGVMVAIYLHEYSSHSSLLYKATRLAASPPSLEFSLAAVSNLCLASSPLSGNRLSRQLQFVPGPTRFYGEHVSAPAAGMARLWTGRYRAGRGKRPLANLSNDRRPRRHFDNSGHPQSARNCLEEAQVQRCEPTDRNRIEGSAPGRVSTI